ncbi:hypothetical protein Bpfe_011305 [Biomphalaria pfeifferi]|uniref:Uncharacterized protein n=1 Tax=Biomphalaria pfeifferi TaxID=112525 RepID=A0AAD8BSY2_BIOPF|nr:hypothetical protein Bpfe_011305 [Biomphalaria pfeifferi]
MTSSEIVNTGPNNGRDRNNELDFGVGIRENLMLGNCFQTIDKNCICETQLQGLNLTNICTSAYISESDLNDGELILAEPDAVMDEHLLMEHYKGASWAYLTDEAEKEYVLKPWLHVGLQLCHETSMENVP